MNQQILEYLKNPDKDLQIMGAHLAFNDDPRLYYRLIYENDTISLECWQCLNNLIDESEDYETFINKGKTNVRLKHKQ